MRGAGGSGVVLASYGRGVLVRTRLDGREGTLRCSLKGRKQRIVCGDQVTWSHQAANDGASIEAIEPRRNLIERIDSRGRAEPVAANIDSLAIVVAPEPAPDWFLVDRYWAGARFKEVSARLVVNKSDLGLDAVRDALIAYRSIGLPCIEVAARAGTGLEQLRLALQGEVTLMVGQSGVGKSSLVNALVPDAAALTSELTRDAEGKHTTTTARWYPFEAASAIVDAPGVRDFAPPATLARAAEAGFVEIHALSAGCRFNDCRHMEEPGCAVRTAVLGGRISARRYESFRRLVRLYEKLA